MPVFWDDDGSGERSARRGLREYYEELIRSRGAVSDAVRSGGAVSDAVRNSGRMKPPWVEREYQRAIADRLEREKFTKVRQYVSSRVRVVDTQDQERDSPSTLFQLLCWHHPTSNEVVKIVFVRGDR